MVKQRVRIMARMQGRCTIAPLPEWRLPSLFLLHGPAAYGSRPEVFSSG